jgi:hypothetical protein
VSFNLISCCSLAAYTWRYVLCKRDDGIWDAKSHSATDESINLPPCLVWPSDHRNIHMISVNCGVCATLLRQKKTSCTICRRALVNELCTCQLPGKKLKLPPSGERLYTIPLIVGMLFTNAIDVS